MWDSVIEKHYVCFGLGSVYLFSTINFIKSFMSISDENLKSELTSDVSLFQRPDMKTF